ncbi:cyclic AMP-dependent transcription factor ATF-7-like isoform X1 [Hypanus sabinus]|uniref:cyclic AMP-dependent transcription factor ATF-7-like isoform X1 n=1 Tax=Hypanus sabinus TaxID=79690 RepID=UPI0028C45C05|nr:cyclic AMP-dependent transcription factor ATF-7-like isoform X1 [Hypanus sabinus]XP_059812192.1 cyclic AMP-dependent transcription factor ATF-7-like isoform X1 [Hypanus sabinus]XP_059812193.1 cyclic AMP-dependent transcription factor ATF-7-like isoform X1 [Hypanus sabinus]XP_059812194.1 cyclic AMP-dependent transcription factor ATF-7-like isoform X1 [Hypanus sabinus]XP_059812195.1 cyclic AMP-dependent transcription factor ATF-7-like isoform X1 [Hypanus sabinus]XP_059812196.1 cyclic AMP-depe
MGDDRPFVCSAPGCGQRFTNEDHLAVHRHKHEMTLKFGPGRDGVIVADQTPTPTRFLKNCEEVGLFTELANPFEQEFKKADEEECKKSPLDVVLPSIPEVKVKETEQMSQGANRPDVSINHPLMEGKDHPPKRPGNTTPTIVRPGSLLLAYESGPSLHPTIPSPTSVITPTPPSNRTLSSPTGPVPVLLHLPNGQTMPVNIPSPTLQIPTVISIARPGSLVPNIPGIPGPTSNNSQPPSPSTPPTQSEAKMRLKSTLTLHNLPMVNGNVISSTMSTQHSQNSNSLPTAVSPSQTQTSLSQPTVPLGGGRRRRGVEEDPDERRRRFLERNRAAASRCRQKRKVWVSSLEKKAEELGHMNVQLQNEVRLLRNEVAQLKQLLLAHKDCPVTAIQRRTQEFIDDSPKELCESSGSPVAVIQRPPAVLGGEAGDGGALRPTGNGINSTTMTPRPKTSPSPHPHVIRAPQSHPAER